MPEIDQPYLDQLVQWRLGDSLAAPMPDNAGAWLAGLAVPYRLPGFAVLDATARRFLPTNGFGARLAFDPVTASYVQTRPWHHSVERYTLFANYTLQHDLGGLFVLNFFDAQPWDYQQVFGAEFTLPVFQYARRVGQRGVILWPAEKNYSGPDGIHCPAANTDTMSLADKRPIAVWRGRLSGTFHHGDELYWAEGIKKELLSGPIKLSEPLLKLLFHRFPRFGLVHGYQRATFCDVGLTHETTSAVHQAAIESDPALAAWQPLFRPQLSRTEQFGCRFIICLDGNDYATGLFWALNSNSVVMMPLARWESLMHFGLTPWVHYIPLDEALSDLEARIAWGNAHLEECAAIAGRAQAFMARNNDAVLRAAADLAVIRR